MPKKKVETRGRPDHQPTPQTQAMVTALAGVAIGHQKIAGILGIALNTLYKHYRQELDNGMANVEAALVQNLLQICKGKDPTALRAIIFTLTARFGWSTYDPAAEAKPINQLILGKKETANRDAQTAHEETSWGELIN